MAAAWLCLASVDVNSDSEVTQDSSSTDVNTDSDTGWARAPRAPVILSSTDINSDSDSNSEGDTRVKGTETKFGQTNKGLVKKVRTDSPMMAGVAGTSNSTRAGVTAYISSSDDDTEPVIDSLRARLARKQHNPLGNVFGTGSNNDTIYNGSTTIEQSCSTTTMSEYSSTVNSVPNFSDSSGDEIEKQSLSQIISSPRISKGKSYIKTCKTSKEVSDNDDIINMPTQYNVKGSVPITDMLAPGSYDINAGTNSMGDTLEPTLPQVKGRKKRSADEVEENKRKAQEKKLERERVKRAREAEKEMRKVERESKKTFSLASCLQYIKVVVDTNIMNMRGLGEVLLKACGELGVACETVPQTVLFTVHWRRRVTECSLTDGIQVDRVDSELEEGDVLAVVPVADFVQMVDNFKQSQCGAPYDSVTLREYVGSLNCQLPGKAITIVVQGMTQYFRDVKTQGQRQHREEVLATDPAHVAKKAKRPRGAVTTVVSRVAVEEALTDTQLHTGCSVYLLDTQDDVADLVRRFTKAVAERPAKKDRFDAIFSFHEEGSSGVKVDKAGHGLLKVWKQQLQQFKNVSPDVAQALIGAYPSPQLLVQAYRRCTSQREAERLLENICVRRGAGVLETTRRVGKELSRRIHTFLTSDDPNLVIK